MMKNRLGVSLSPIKCRFGPLLFSGKLDMGLEKVKKLRFDGVELSLLDSSVLDQQHIIAETRRLGLQVFSIATGQSYITDGLSLFAGDDAVRQKTIKRIQNHIDFAANLGSAVIVGGIRGKVGGSGEQAGRCREKGEQAFRECAQYAEKKGVVVLLEPINRYETDVVNTAEQGVAFIEKCGCGNARLLLDTFHMNIEERSIEESIKSAGEHLGYMHFADSNRYAPGMGHCRFFDIMEVLVSMNYPGPIVFEILPLPDDEKAAEQGISFVRRLMEQLN